MPRATTQWIVVANGAKARIFSRLAPAGALELVSEHSSDDARHPSKDLGSDRPGRTFDSAGPGRHAMEPRGDFQELAKEAFVRDLARDLDQAATEGLFHELILIAAPRALHGLREGLSGPAQGRVVRTLDKDLTAAAPADIAKHLEA